MNIEDLKSSKKKKISLIRLKSEEDKIIYSETTKEIEQRGMLISSGLITGEALVGILMAIPIVIAGKSDVAAIFGVHDYIFPGILLILVLLFAIYKFSTSND